MTVGPDFTRIAKQEPHKSYLKVLLKEARQPRQTGRCGKREQQTHHEPASG